MENFIFSLNATMPVFLIIVLGYLLRRFGMFTEEFVRNADRFNFRVALPILLFVDIATADIKSRFDWHFVVFCMVVTTIAFFSIWGIARVALKDKSMVGAFTMSSFRGSAAVLGIAFVTNIYGDAGLTPLMIVAVVPFYNMYSVLAMTFTGKREGEAKISVRHLLFEIVTNPLILSVFLALPFAVWNIRIPKIPLQTLDNVGSIATPLALLVLGAGFEGGKALTKLRPTLLAALNKLVILPGIFVPIAILCGFRDAALVAIAIMLASPTTVACYIMARNMKNDDVLTSGIVTVTTLFSSVTITLMIYILRTLGFI